MVAYGIIAGIRIRVSRLVGVQVDGPDPQQAPSTLGPGQVDGVADAAVPEPAGAAHVHAVLPGQVEFPCGC